MHPLNGYHVLVFLSLLNSASCFPNQSRSGFNIIAPGKTAATAWIALQSIFTIRINEDGQTYQETVRIDSARHLEYFLVSAHRNTNGADFILDFKKNLTLVRIPRQRMCYLRRLIDDVPKPKQLQKNLLQPLKSNEGVRTEVTTWRVSTILRKKDILNAKMKQLCRGMPVYLMTEDTTGGQTREITKRSSCGGHVCFWARRCYKPCYNCKPTTCIRFKLCKKIVCWQN